LLRKQQKTLGGYFFLPHPVHPHAQLSTYPVTHSSIWHWNICTGEPKKWQREGNT